MDNLSLYKINKDFEDCMRMCIDQETGEIINEKLYPMLDNIHYAMEEKCDNIVAILHKLDDRSEAIDKEIKRLKSLKELNDKHYDSLKAYLQNNIPQGEKIETNFMTISWRKSKSVQILDLGQIPTEYIRTKITEEPDKTSIKKAIENGKKVAGAILIENNNIQIK